VYTKCLIDQGLLPAQEGNRDTSDHPSVIEEEARHETVDPAVVIAALKRQLQESEDRNKALMDARSPAESQTQSEIQTKVLSQAQSHQGEIPDTKILIEEVREMKSALQIKMTELDARICELDKKMGEVLCECTGCPVYVSEWVMKHFSSA